MNTESMLKKLERTLNAEVKNGTKSPRTATEYVNVARKLSNGDYTDNTIPSKARWLQISAVLSYLKDYELISEAENFGLHPRALKKRYKAAKTQNAMVKAIEEKVLTDAQYQSILAALPSTSDGHQLKFAVELSHESNMRMSEVLSRKHDHFAIGINSISVEVTGKRNKPRNVYLPLSFIAKLDQFFAAHPDGFTIDQNYINTTYRRTVRKVGIKTTFHALRHTWATIQAENGMDLLTLSQLMGHADPKTTMIYTHVKRACPQQLLDMWAKNGK